VANIENDELAAAQRFGADNPSAVDMRDWRGPAVGTYRSRSAVFSSEAKHTRTGAMAWFTKLGLRAQLMASFAMVIVLAVLVGGVSLVKIQEMKRSAEFTEVNEVPSLNAVADLESTIRQYRVDELETILSSGDAAERQANEKAMADDAKAVNEVIAAYKALSSDALDTSTITDVESKWTALQSSSTKAVKLADSGDVTGAVAYATGDESKLLNSQLLPATEAVHSDKTGDVNKSVNKAKKDAEQAISIVISLLVVSVIVGFGVAWLISRRTVRRLGKVSHVLGDVSSRLSTISDSAEADAGRTAQAATAAASGTEQVAMSVQTVASAVEEMNISIQDISRNAGETSRVASSAVDTTRTASESVAQLREASVEIGQVLEMISSIAEQTNLLALNATIEAARAGEAGKGFAVVASEVKDLAQETTKATDDIRTKIDAIQSSTQDAVGSIAEVSAVIESVNELSTSIAGAVEEQSATTAEIARSVGEAANGTENITRTVSELSTFAMSSRQSATEVQSATQELGATQDDLKAVIGS
jgi:methyl-accepting chemotaxis protein